MANKSNSGLVPITVCRPEDWVTTVYRLRIMRQWCEERGIEALEMGGLPDEFPHTVLIPEADAVAFKLKFGKW